MVRRISVLGTLQKPDSNKTVTLNFINGGTIEKIAYTTPTGKVAIVKSFLTKMGSFGSGTYLDWKAGGVSLRRTISPTDLNEAQAIEIAGNGIRLSAGQTISYQGDSAANNSDGSLYLTIQELDV